LMASCIRNVCAKNRQNPLILFKVTIDNVGVPFFETQCTWLWLEQSTLEGLHKSAARNASWDACHVPQWRPAVLRMLCALRPSVTVDWTLTIVHGENHRMVCFAALDRRPLEAWRLPNEWMTVNIGNNVDHYTSIRYNRPIPIIYNFIHQGSEQQLKIYNNGKWQQRNRQNIN